MKPIEYLRGVMLRDRAQPAPEPKPEPAATRDIPWTNPVHTDGACIHDVIYSTCRCPDTNISARTRTADYRTQQQ